MYVCARHTALYQNLLPARSSLFDGTAQLLHYIAAGVYVCVLVLGLYPKMNVARQAFPTSKQVYSNRAAKRIFILLLGSIDVHCTVFSRQALVGFGSIEASMLALLRLLAALALA